MFQPVREYVLRHATRQVTALAFAGLLAFPLLATQGRDQADARSSGPPPTGSSISGPARVVDGDTIVIGATRIRLEGIDAPESAQTCGRRWFGTWPCGEAATSHLAALARDRIVRCDSHGIDVYGRMLGICFTEGLELNADMVRNGLAWAFVKYSSRLVEAEAGARALRLGIWQGEATPAWVWRAQRWSAAMSETGARSSGAAAEEARRDCVIKGNITRNGHIYHMPWSPWYGRTKVEPARGERWFCSETEAVAAGWRPASNR
jgi:endonuclease YncB( thermonuclease family)